MLIPEIFNHHGTAETYETSYKYAVCHPVVVTDEDNIK